MQITGGGDAGLLYGVQTLRQMIRQEGLVAALPPPGGPACPFCPGPLL
ncbi:MAG: glycoside hydrolase family 20 zincin-like fold domain-containing protein [Oscillospiraceae bacterium]